MSLKVLLISPKNSNPQALFWTVAHSLKVSSERAGRPIKAASYPLALPLIASFIKQVKADADIQIIDENLNEIESFKISADLVCITANTIQVERAFQLAKAIREVNKGVKVLVGGAHFGNTRNEETIEEALNYVDAVVIGESDNLWGEILEDLENKTLKETYFCGRNFPQLDTLVLPGFDLLALESYLARNLETSRGCNKRCSFCNVTTKLRFKNPDHVVAEIKHLREVEHKKGAEHRSIFFTDNLLNPIKQLDISMRLMEKLIHYKEEKFLGDELSWFGQVNSEIGMKEFDEFLTLMARAGAKRLFIGFEGFYYQKEANKVTPGERKKIFSETIRKVRSKGIDVMGAFVVGFETEPDSMFGELADFINESGLVVAQVTILTPLPGTRDFKTFREAGRLPKKNGRYDWNQFNATNNLITPRPNTINKQEEYYKLLKRIYSDEAINKRISIRQQILPYGPQEHVAEQVLVRSFQEVALALSKDVVI